MNVAVTIPFYAILCGIRLTSLSTGLTHVLILKTYLCADFTSDFTLNVY